MKKMAILLSVLFLIVACGKEKIETRDAKIIVTVFDESGNTLANVPVKMYDEKEYELFKKDNLTLPALVDKTDSKGLATFVFPQEQWFVKQTQRFFSFVVMEGGGPDNYQIWSSGKTIKAGEIVEIQLRLTGFPPE